jgi:hypothetical protein
VHAGFSNIFYAPVRERLLQVINLDEKNFPLGGFVSAAKVWEWMNFAVPSLSFIKENLNNDNGISHSILIF